MLPNSDEQQIQTLKKLNEKPLPLPCVFLHPLVKATYYKLHDKNVGYDITIPFKNIINNSKEYLNLGLSNKYFTKFKEQLRNCERQKEAEAFLDTISVAFGVPGASAEKIRAEFDTIFDTGITDISWKHQELWKTSK